MNLVNVSCYVGILFLSFVCFLDFKRNIPKPKPVLPFNIALFLFLIANAVVYIGLLPVLAGIEFNLNNLAFSWGGGDNLELFKFRNISPLLIAVLYFGFGKAKIEIGNKEFSFYNSLLSIFRSMFPRSLGVSKKLKEYIENLGTETTKLYGTIENIQIIAKNYNWKLYIDEWAEISKTKKMIEDEIDFLDSVKASLILDPPSPQDIDNAKESIIRQIQKSRIKIIDKLRNYLRKIIAENVYHEKSIDELISLIEVEKPEEIIEKSKSNYIARAFGISFLCGILLSGVLSMDSIYSSPERIIYLVTSFFFFLAIFSFLHTVDNTIEGFSFAVLIGSVGGFIGHLAFNIISRKLNLSIFDGNSSILAVALSIISMNVRGVVIGSLSGAIAFLFKYKVNKAIQSNLIKYILISICGGITMLGVSFLFSDFAAVSKITKHDIMIPVLTGCIVLMGISFVSGLFEKERHGSPKTKKENINEIKTDNEKKVRQRFKLAS